MGAHLYALEINRKGCISGHTNSKGISKIRVGKECRVQYTADDDRTNVVVPNLSTDDLSLDSIRWAISQHRRSFDAAAALDDPSEFLLQARLIQAREEPGSAVTMAALILFGRQAALSRYAPYCQTVLTVPSGHTDIRKNIVETIRDLAGSEQALLRQLLPSIPSPALHELLVNAYMHRCWRTNGPVVITVADGGLEIANPGDLLPGLHVDSLIHCVPIYRNLLLAESLRYCGLADKIGQGIDIVFRSTICGGLDFPSFESQNNLFRVRLSANQAPEFREFVKSRGSSLSNLDELVVLRYLWGRPDASAAALGTAIQRGRDAVHRIANSMCKKQLIEFENGGYRLTQAMQSDIASIFSRDQMQLFGS